MAILIDNPRFSQITDDLELLTYEPILFACDHGLVLYTMAHWQVTLHVLVPETGDITLEFLQTTVMHMMKTYPSCAMNMNPLKCHVSFLHGNVFAKRRFVPSTKFVAQLDLIEEGRMVRCLEVDLPLFRCLHDPRELAATSWRPISRMSHEDEDGTLYWYRFKSGCIGVFSNPLVSAVNPVSFPMAVPTSDSEVYTHVHTKLHPFILSLYPDSTDDTIRVLGTSCIPSGMREFSLVSGVKKCGLTDDLLLITHQHLEVAETEFVHDMLSISWLMLVQKTLSPVCMGHKLSSLLREFLNRPLWIEWIQESDFVARCIDALPMGSLETVCHRFSPLLLGLVNVVAGRIGRWSRGDVQKAIVLERCANEFADVVVGDPRLLAIEEELKRAQGVADEVATALCVETSKLMVSDEKKLCSRKKTAKGHLQVPACDGDNHLRLLAEMRSRYPFAFDLIGSGLFTAESDADFVVTTSSSDATLEEAYERVKRHTGWAPCYTSISGEHVAVLVGEVNGVAIDVQVWRGHSCQTLTKSEVMTRQALELSTRLAKDVDDRTLGHIRWLHRWSAAASVKGHCHCRLPGIAVTAIAIAMSRHEWQEPTALLSTLLHRHLMCACPQLDMDGVVDSGSPNECASSPLSIVVDGKNCATRMTRATSRHFMHVVLFAVSLEPEVCLSHEVYRAWRRQAMVRCGRVRPLLDCSVSHTLHKVAHSFDGHPFIDSLFFEQEVSGCILVLCTLSRHTDVAHYGFTSADHIFFGDDGEEFVTVRRNTRHMRLMLSYCDTAISCVPHATAVCDMIAVRGGFSFPNAPSLSVDVVGRFDPKFWECVW